LWPSEKPRRTSDRRRGDDGQVEQDWVLSRAVVELFSRPELKGKLVLRGGTALNKLLQPSHLAIGDRDALLNEARAIGFREPVHQAGLAL
jgi:hypothetical protein